MAVLGAATLLLAGPGHGFGAWSYGVSFKLMEYAAYAGIGTAVLALPGVVFLRGSRALALAALLIAAITAWVPYHQLQRVKGLPHIHDISTDTQNPPGFMAVLPLRSDALNTAVYQGAKIAAQQHSAYPDIQPLFLKTSPAATFERALATARASRWEIVAAEAASGRIEATDTTFWFGFKDDVVVRISPAGDGSRVDVRSVSRVGRSDIGANAARIRGYLAALKRQDRS